MHDTRQEDRLLGCGAAHCIKPAATGNDSVKTPSSPPKRNQSPAAACLSTWENKHQTCISIHQHISITAPRVYTTIDWPNSIDTNQSATQHSKAQPGSPPRLLCVADKVHQASRNHTASLVDSWPPCPAVIYVPPSRLLCVAEKVHHAAHTTPARYGC